MSSALRFLLGAVLGGLWLLFAACSSSGPPGDSAVDGRPPDRTLMVDRSPDRQAPADRAAVIDQEPVCGPTVYPCGPYGVAVGDVAENLVVKGFADPGYLCKKPKDQTNDLGHVVPLSFKKWFLGDAACPDPRHKLLWVIVGAGWCPGCVDEAEEVQKLYAAAQIDARVAVFGLVIQTQNLGEPCTEAFLKAYADNTRFTLSYPVGMDPTLKVTKYIATGALPGAMLLELSTMKVLKRGAIAPQEMISAIQQYFNP